MYTKWIRNKCYKKEYCQNFVYPTPYELHFSKMYASQYMHNPMKYIATMHGTDKDLAAHMTIVYHFGKVIGGQNIKDVFVLFQKNII